MHFSYREVISKVVSEILTTKNLFLFSIFFVRFHLFSFSISLSAKKSDFNWPGLGPDGLGRLGSRPGSGSNPGRLKVLMTSKNSLKCSETIRRGSGTVQKRFETIQKRTQNTPNAIRKCCEIGPKIVQTVKQKVVLIFLVGCRVRFCIPGRSRVVLWIVSGRWMFL